ncbi:MAG: RecQ family ATP-dependent DNA helicase, partial [Flavobacteriales bacterium]
MSQTINDILKLYWGYDSFRDSQEEIISSVLDGNNTLALLPTGGGKSICYQVPALVNEGICVVVSPLIALMKDQVENLNKRGIKALAIYSGMNKREIDIALDNCVYGNYKFLYVSPERLQTEIFKVRVAKMKVNLIAVDESHCISQWGHDFRPAYQKIKDLREIIDSSVPFLAVTATANKRVITDISEQLSIGSSHVIKQSFYRENLGYLVLKIENKKERLLQILKKTNSCGIVYANTRRKTVETAQFLASNGFRADYYHGGLTQDDRDRKQQNWIENKTQIIVATNAFGMGIDKPDVRVVVHLEPPASPEAYFQEAGRGGRDGKQSFGALLYKPSDKLNLEKFHELEFPEISLIKKIYNSLGNYFRLAIGGGEGISYEFNLGEFCNQFNFDVIKTHHALSILSLAGYISLSEAISRPNKVKFKVNNNELYNYQIKHPEHEKLIQILLRNNESIFDSLIGVNLTQIGEKLNKKASEV